MLDGNRFILAAAAEEMVADPLVIMGAPVRPKPRPMPVVKEVDSVPALLPCPAPALPAIQPWGQSDFSVCGVKWSRGKVLLLDIGLKGRRQSGAKAIGLVGGYWWR